MSSLQIVRLMNREDKRVARAVRKELPAIARAADVIAAALRSGGRLFYIGAGSSGRLAILDAAEYRPTFGVPPELVQAVIAGGKRAITGAVEGAEDSAPNAAKDLRRRRLTRKDVVVGIAASGTTPYVLGALKYARSRGARTVAVTSNSKAPVAREADIAIAPVTGPEVLTGSTRLKSGTMQKMVLNMLSTAAMVRLGRVYENLMIDVAQTNRKLIERGQRILESASGADARSAKHALRQAGNNLRVALIMLKRKCSAGEARTRLRESKGNLRAALGETAGR